MSWICTECGHTWQFPVETCIRCRAPVEKRAPGSLSVKGVTEVANRWGEQDVVPYYVLLLEDDDGRMLLRHSYHPLEIGELIDGEHAERALPKIGVVGPGVTGTGIAQVALLAGCKVVLAGRRQESLDGAVRSVSHAIEKRVADLAHLETRMSALKITTDLDDLSFVDIVIEAVPENMAIKQALFKELGAICSESVVLATNTSSLSIDEIADVTQHPGRVVGMHFFNPILKMRLVEIVCGSQTSESTIEFTRRTSLELNKSPVIVKDSPGFIVNRLLMTYLSEAVALFDQGVASKEDIDTAIELGLNYPMGPLRLLDLIGVDVFADIILNLEEHIPEKFKLPPLIGQMRAEGNLGRKSRRGFYDY